MNKENFLKYLRGNPLPPEARAMLSPTDGSRVSNEFALLFDREAQSWPIGRFATRYSADRDSPKISLVASDPVINFIEEAGTISESEVELKGGSLPLYKVVTSLVVTEEVFFDSGISVDAMLARAFGRALSLKLEKTFLTGDGTGKPRGLLLDCQAVEAADNVPAYDDLVNIFNTLNEALLPFASWVVSRDTLALLSGLSDGSGNRFLIPDTTGVTAGYILGRPVFVSFLPPDKPIIFGDISQFTIVERTPTIQRLSELYSEKGFIGFLYKQRLNARLFNHDAIIALTTIGE